jgi:hypothetical protein
MNTEDDVIDMITEALYMYHEEYGSDDPAKSVGTARLHDDRGLVLTIGDKRFQITVVEA